MALLLLCAAPEIGPPNPRTSRVHISLLTSSLQQDKEATACKWLEPLWYIMGGVLSFLATRSSLHCKGPVKTWKTIAKVFQGGGKTKN